MGLMNDRFIDDAKRWQGELSDKDKAHLKRLITEAVHNAIADREAQRPTVVARVVKL